MIICRPFGTSVMARTDPPGVDDHDQCRAPRVWMVRRTTLVGITATGDAGVLLIPVLSGSFEGAFPVSTSRLGQAFEHRLDAQAQTGLRYCLKRFKPMTEPAMRGSRSIPNWRFNEIPQVGPA